MAIRKVQSSRDGLYHVSLPKDLAESLGLKKGTPVDIRLKNNKLELARAG